MGIDTRKFHGAGGNYIKAKDVEAKGGKVAVTIGSVDQIDDKGNPKLVLEFAGNGKRLSLNKGNLRVLEDAFGYDTDAWKGKAIQLHFDPSVKFKGDTVGGIKIVVAA